MNASNVATAPQAPTPLPAPVQHLFLTEYSQSTAKRVSGSLDPHELQLRATTITVVLKEIMVDHGEYRDFGIND